MKNSTRISGSKERLTSRKDSSREGQRVGRGTEGHEVEVLGGDDQRLTKPRRRKSSYLLKKIHSVKNNLSAHKNLPVLLSNIRLLTDVPLSALSFVITLKQMVVLT